MIHSPDRLTGEAFPRDESFLRRLAALALGRPGRDPDDVAAARFKEQQRIQSDAGHGQAMFVSALGFTDRRLREITGDAKASYFNE